ncbi:ribonuclease H-like domain-containing protein [Tanacetum coccineum]
MSDHDDDASDINNDNAQPQQQQNIQPQIITTVSNNNAKFPYLKKDEYEVWAMKMEYWITNNDMNIWKVIQNGNSLKRTGRDRDGRVIILPPTTADEHIVVQRESKARTTLASSLFLMINCGLISIIMGGGNEARDDMEGSQSLVHSGFDLKTKGGTELAFFEDLYYKFEDTYVLHSLIAESEPEQQVAYEDFEQIDKLDLEEMDIKWQMAMLSVRVNKLEKKGEGNIEFDKKEAVRFNKKAVRCYKCLQKGYFARECRAKGENEKRYSSFKIQELGKKEADTNTLITVNTLENWKEHKSGDDEGFAPKEYGMVAGYGDAYEEGAAEVYSLITGNGTDAAIGEFALMGMTSEEQNCPFGSEIAKKYLQTKLDNHLAKTEKWTSSSKNLFRLIDSSMSVRTKVGLGFDTYIGEIDGKKAVPPPLFGNYIPLSDTTDLDETQMTYGKKSTCSIDSISVSNDFVSCDNSDKSSEIKSNDYAYCVSSVKSSEPMTIDSSSNASISSVSTHASEANLESSEGITIQEPIIVQELPSFSCTDKDVKTSRTPCNKNGYFNKKSSHFRKNNSYASKSCFDNATRVTQSNQFVPQAVLLRSGKVSIPAARPNQVLAGRPKPVSTGRPKQVSTGAPVSIGKQNRPPLVHAGRRNSSLVTSGWWQSTARPMAYLPTPTSSYF